MNKAYLLIGGNISSRENYLEQARLLIGEFAGTIITLSVIYETAAWGITDQNAFLNQVLLIETPFAAAELLPKLLSIEEKLGRIRTVKFGPRIIDIDILLFNSEIINSANLKVPHPALVERRFALVPLCEIAPDYIHTVFNKSIQQLLDECKDELQVEVYNS